MKTNLRRLLVLFLCLLLPLPLLRAYDVTIDDIVYSIEDGEAIVARVEDMERENYVIQAEVDGVPVTRIGSDAFWSCDVQSITIPATINEIGEYSPRDAFSFCNELTEINVAEDNAVFASRDGVLYSKDQKILYYSPENLRGTFTVPDGVTTICEDAFAYTQLERIVLPESVSDIDYAFACAYNLTSFEVAAGNENYTAIDGVLYSAGGTEIVCYPPARPEAVFTFPDTVRRIGEDTFYDALYLAGMVIGDSVVELHQDYALEDGNVFFVQTDNKIVKAWLEEKTREILVVGTEDEAPQIVTVGGVIYAIYDDEAFAFRVPNKYVKSFNIPHTINGYPVTMICSDIVYGCYDLEEVAIGDNVTAFGEYAFEACDNLSTIYTDNDFVEEWFADFDEDFTFLPYSDYSYETTINGIVYSIAQGEATAIRAENAKTSSLEILPEVDGVPVTAIGEAAFAMRGATIHVSLPDSLKTIGNYAFDRNYNLYDIVLPPSLVEIGDYAFSWCESLASMTIPATVESIGECVFVGQNQLSAIEVANGNVHFFSIDGVLYQIAEARRSVEAKTDGAILVRYPPQKSNSEFTVPDGVTVLADGSFDQCLNLAVVNLPASVEDVTGLASRYGLNDYGTKFSTVNVAAGNEHFASRDGVLYTADMSELLTYPRAKADTAFTIPAETSAGYEVLGSSDLQAIYVEDGNEAFASRDGVLFTADMSELLLYPNAKVSNEFTVPAEMIYGWEKLASVKLQDFQVEDGNETYASRDGVLYSADMTTLLIYPGDRKDAVFAIPEEVVYIDCYSAFEMAKNKGNLKGLVIGDNVLVYDEFGHYSFFDIIFQYWWSLKYVQTDNADVIDWFANNRPEVLIVSRADEPPELPYETIVNGIKYYVNTFGGEVEVIGAISKKITEAVIPEEIDGYPVTRLGWSYYNESDYEGNRSNFEYCFYLERVVLPSNLRLLGEDAFRYCYNLKEITLPEGLEELDSAFYGCTGLTSLAIPPTVEFIDVGAFRGCTNLQSLTVDADNENYSSVDGVLYDKDCTVLVCCPEGKETLTLPATVESLSPDYEYDDYWNLGTSLKSIDVEEGNEVFASQDGVLYTAGLKKLVFYPYEKEGDTFTLPATVTEIKAGGLYGFSGQEYKVAEGNTSYTTLEGVLYTADMTSLVAYPWKHPATVFTLPETVSNLNIDSYYLVAVVIPNAEIDFDEFELLGNRLTFVQTDNEYVRSIADKNEYGNVTEGLIFLGMDEEMPEMPRFVQQDGLCFRLLDGEAAVIGVKDLGMTEVVIPEQVEGCPVTAIQGKGTIKLPIMHSLSIPDTLIDLSVDHEDDELHITHPYTSQWFEHYEVTAGNPVFSSRDGVLFSADGSVLVHYPQAKPDTVYTIPDGCQTITSDSMYDLLYLETLVIPDSVETIENWAFGDDYTPRFIVIGDGLKNIGNNLFEDYDQIEIIYTDNEYVKNWLTANASFIEVLPRDDWGFSVKCQIAQGWNLVGIPLELDETSKEALDAYRPLTYDFTAKTYVFAGTDYVPGTAVWLFSTTDGMLILRGTPIQSTGTNLLKGWNLVSPPYGETANPGLDQIWQWTSDSRQKLKPEDPVEPGKGYWIYSEEAQIIW